MKAVLCKAYGPPESLVIEDIEPLKPGIGQVVIGVKACGVNFPDTLIIQGKYQFKPELPFTPGSELAGVVRAVGEGVAQFKTGDKVLAFVNQGAFSPQVAVPGLRQIAPPAGRRRRSAPPRGGRSLTPSPSAAAGPTPATPRR